MRSRCSTLRMFFLENQFPLFRNMRYTTLSRPTPRQSISYSSSRTGGRQSARSARPGGAAAHDLVGEERMKVVHGIDLHPVVSPSAAECGDPALHLAEHSAPSRPWRRATYRQPDVSPDTGPPSRASPPPAITKLAAGCGARPEVKAKA